MTPRRMDVRLSVSILYLMHSGYQDVVKHHSGDNTLQIPRKRADSSLYSLADTDGCLAPPSNDCP